MNSHSSHSPTPTPLRGKTPLTAGRLADRIPLRILVADDVLTNRQVIGLILRYHGYRFDSASNGIEVLAALREQRYDLLLLDVKMPLMDGLAATQEIHRLYPAAADRPLIVALTANVLPGDREECLAAGMDDYLAKPISHRILAGCIERLFAAAGASAPAAASSPPPPPTVAWLDTAHLSALAQGLPAAHFAATLEQMRLSAGDDYAAIFSQVENACTAQDVAALATAVHGLKGCFQMLGWARAAHYCQTALRELHGQRFTRWAVFPAELHALHQHSDELMQRHVAQLASAHSADDHLAL